MSHRRGKKIALLASILVMVCLSLPLFFSGCGLANEPSEYDFHAIEGLQEEVPFTIVVPTYFPEGIYPYPTVIGGPDILELPYEHVALTLTYEERGANHAIWIWEANLEVIFVPSGPSSIYLDFAGIQVMEEETEAFAWAQPDDSSSDTQLIQGFSYKWSRDGVTFEVDVFGYERDECRRIIESMIQPIE